MTPLPATAILALLAVLLAGPAGAQTIYRCGNEYTRVPCPGGRPLDTGDTRSAAQRAEARRILAEEERRGREMERERHRNEAAIKPATATQLTPTPAAASAASAPKKPAPKKRRRKAEIDPERDFVAAAPPRPRASSASR